MKKLIFYILIVILLSSSLAQTTIETITKNLQRSTVLLIVVDFDRQEIITYGSGFISRNSQGEIRVYTAFHVVADKTDDQKITVGLLRDVNMGTPDMLYTAEIAACDPEVDLAVLKISERRGRSDEMKTWYPIEQDEVERYLGNKTIEIELSNHVKIGESTHMAGYPWLGLQNTFWQYSRGTIAGRANAFLLIGSTQPFDHGQSGGPIVNEKGKVVAIADAITNETRQANLAVPARELKLLWANEDEYTDNCNYEPDILTKTMPIEGKILNQDSDPLENVDVYIVNKVMDMEEFLNNPDASYVLASSKTNGYGEFSCEPELEYPEYYNLAIIDPQSKYKSTSGLVFLESGSMFNIYLESDENYSESLFSFSGDIGYDTGSKITKGLITVFYNQSEKDRFLIAMQSDDPKEAQKYVIGNGEIENGKYYITLDNEPNDSVDFTFVVIDVERAKITNLNNVELKDSTKIILPWK